MIKKVVFVVVALIALTSVVKAQETGFGFGPKVGMNISNMTKDGKGDSKIGMMGGVFVDYRFSNLFALSADVLFSRQGMKEDIMSEDVKLATSNLNVPIMANFYVFKGLAVKAGIQPGFLLSAKVKADGEKLDAKDAFKKFDLAIPVGVSYDFNCGLIVDARYNLGLTNISDSSDADSKNSVFAISVGWRF